MLKSLNQLIVFLMELMMLGSFAYYGYHKSTSPFGRFFFACALPTLAIIVWARFAAPKSPHRLVMPYLALFRTLMFLLASFSIYQFENKCLAITFAFLAMATQLVSYVVES